MNDYLLFDVEDASKLSPKFLNDSVTKLENEISKHQESSSRGNELEVLSAKLELTKRIIWAVGEPKQEYYNTEVFNALLIAMGDTETLHKRYPAGSSAERELSIKYSMLANSVQLLHKRLNIG